jgi:hypothetical protein
MAASAKVIAMKRVYTGFFRDEPQPVHFLGLDIGTDFQTRAIESMEPVQ